MFCGPDVILRAPELQKMMAGWNCELDGVCVFMYFEALRQKEVSKQKGIINLSTGKGPPRQTDTRTQEENPFGLFLEKNF